MGRFFGVSSVVTLEAVLGDLAAERVAVHAEQVGGLAEIAVRAREHVRDEALLELALRILVADTLGHHFVDELIEGVAQQRHQASVRSVRRRNASRYFSRVRAMTSSGSDGTG